MARFALFVVFFWFGVLKLLGVSPASALVLALLGKTLPFIEPALFMKLFAVFEMLIGILFLFPKFTKIALVLVGLHLITTTAPLILLPNMTWSGLFIPTLEGQYIIKNILIVAVAWGIYKQR
ncbi:MAG: hypothetical protein KBD47_01305 [Candidatus Pacebacteria bacterium]|nr:hypothetical protein [Candidatus Paceibacterota bacterium]